mgnify:CR=1 FL=1
MSNLRLREVIRREMESALSGGESWLTARLRRKPKREKKNRDGSLRRGRSRGK